MDGWNWILKGPAPLFEGGDGRKFCQSALEFLNYWKHRTIRSLEYVCRMGALEARRQLSKAGKETFLSKPKGSINNDMCQGGAERSTQCSRIKTSMVVPWCFWKYAGNLSDESCWSHQIIHEFLLSILLVRATKQRVSVDRYDKGKWTRSLCGTLVLS